MKFVLPKFLPYSTIYTIIVVDIISLILTKYVVGKEKENILIMGAKSP